MRGAKIIAVLAFTVFGSMFALNARADDWTKKSKITFDQAIEVPGRALPAGTYTFKLLDSDSASRNVVQIFNADGTKLITTVLAIHNYRLKPTGNTVMLFSERPANTPPALKAWFYPNNSWGHEFVYPKARAVQLAEAANEPVPAFVEEPKAVAEMRTAPLVAETPERKEVPFAEVFPITPPTQDRLLVAQAATLPKTGSMIPFVVMISIVTIGIAFGLRRFANQRG